MRTQPSIKGRIISVPPSIYEDADKASFSIEKTNQLAATIRTIIQTELKQQTSIKYVVIAGSDEIVPHYRLPDETIIGNERTYLSESFLKPGSPLFFSILGGYNLTDDFYTDAQPIPWQGRALYVPDIAISRLVETPQEIINTAQTFITNGGILNPTTALVTGYDFFIDGAERVADILNNLDPETLINDTWTKTDLDQL